MKCFVTKLPVSVDNDSLDYFGYVRIDVNSTVNTALNVNSGARPLNAFIIGDGYFTNANGDNLGKTNNTINSNAIISKGTYKVYVPKFCTFNFDLCRDAGDKTTIDARQLNGSNFPNFNASVRKLTGNLAEITIPITEGLSSLNVELAYNHKFKGTIEDIARLFPNAESIVLEGNWQITGDLGCLLTDDGTALKNKNLKTLNIRYIDALISQKDNISKLENLGVTILKK